MRKPFAALLLLCAAPLYADDVTASGKVQLGSAVAGSASCIAVSSDQLYGDKDCDGTKDAGEEFLDLTGGAGGGSGGGTITEDEILALSGLTMWLDADDFCTSDGAAVTTWTDRSAAGNSPTQATSTMKPTCQLAELNGKDVVNFDGGDCLVDASIGISTFDVFVVVRATSDAIIYEHSPIVDSNDGSYLYTDVPAINVKRSGVTSSRSISIDWGNQNIWMLVQQTYRGTHPQTGIYLSGYFAAGGTGTGNNPGTGTTTTEFNLGCRNEASLFLNGEIAEILVFTPYIAESDSKRIRTYLAEKYALPLADGGGGDGSNTAETGEYHPDRKPAGGGTFEDWDDTEDQTWTAFNIGSATKTLKLDGVVVDGGASNTDQHGWYFPSPGAGNWLWACKMSDIKDAVSADDIGIIALTGGTSGSPTFLTLVQFVGVSSTTADYRARTVTSYANAGNTERGAIATINETQYMTVDVYLLIRFTDSSDLVEPFFSYNGKEWIAFTSHTGGSSSPLVGISVRQGAKARFDWCRLITDAEAITNLAIGAPQP